MANLVQPFLCIKAKTNSFMKFSKSFALLLLLCSSPVLFAQISPPLERVENIPLLEPAFQPGELLQYKIKYGFISAGEAELGVKEDKVIAGHKTTHLVASGFTTSAVKLLVKVNNRYDSYIDQETVLPYLFTESVKEDNYRRDGYVNFDRNKNRVITNKETEDVPAGTMDIISAFYYARSLDLSQVKVGDVFHLRYYMEDSDYPLDITYLGKENVKTKLGTFSCLKFSPSVLPGRVFREDSKMYLWITDDLNRVPLKVEAEILIGSIYMELMDYSGLKYPMAQKLSKKKR